MATCVDVAGATLSGRKCRQAASRPWKAAASPRRSPARPIDREPIFWEHEGNRAVRVGKWKLVAKGPAGSWELYDMEADRTEMHDLAATDPQRVKAMAAQWEACAKRTKALPWPWKPTYGAARVREWPQRSSSI